MAADIRFQPDESPPLPLAVGLGLQQAGLSISGIVFTPVVVITAAGIADTGYTLWAVFAALGICGISTILQSVRIGRIGAGYPLLMGTSGAFIAVSVTALAQGGPGVFATLVAVAALFQFAFSYRLALLRRIITPAVAGTVIMLIAVTIMPILFQLMNDVPAGADPVSAPVTWVVTLLAIIALALIARGQLRLWVPVIGLAIGAITSIGFGIYDFDRVREAAWIGIPAGGWPGMDFSFGPVFWTLLPAFLLVTLVGAIETVGDAIAIQQVAWRQKRAADYRSVQGALAADGIGNLLSGLAGTVPNTTYSSSVAVSELTGVAARPVGIWIGITFVVAAFVPKVAAILLAIPNPVVTAYLTVLLAMLFVLGMRMVIESGIDYRLAVVVGVAFWLGVGFQEGAIFGDRLGPRLGALLGNGMTAGALAAILMNLFIEATGPRRRVLELPLADQALSGLLTFLGDAATRARWSPRATGRLLAVGEETLQSLLQAQQRRPPEDAARLRLTARLDRAQGELEFVAGPGGCNLEDQMVALAEHPDSVTEQALSVRLLEHYASGVRHQKYFDTDVITVRVAAC